MSNEVFVLAVCIGITGIVLTIAGFILYCWVRIGR